MGTQSMEDCVRAIHQIVHGFRCDAFTVAPQVGILCLAAPAGDWRTHEAARFVMEAFLELPRQHYACITLSYLHRAEMLDFAGLARGHRMMVQASVGRARDFDRTADALIVKHPRIRSPTTDRKRERQDKV